MYKSNIKKMLKERSEMYTTPLGAFAHLPPDEIKNIITNSISLKILRAYNSQLGSEMNQDSLRDIVGYAFLYKDLMGMEEVQKSKTSWHLYSAIMARVGEFMDSLDGIDTNKEEFIEHEVWMLINQCYKYLGDIIVW